MYLLWEWTEEREGKILHGIFSTVGKAKAAAELSDENEVSWSEDGGGLVGYSMSEFADSDYPFEITKFEVDTYTTYKYGPGTDNPTIKKVEL